MSFFSSIPKNTSNPLNPFMIMKPNDEYSELNYYIVYLQDHLREHYFPQSLDRRFVAERADIALDTYATLFLQGRPQYICHELAMRELLKGLYVSRYDVVHTILEEDLWRRVPSDELTVKALYILTKPAVHSILDRHEVNGDFLSREDYPPLRDELIATITKILDGDGL